MSVEKILQSWKKKSFKPVYWFEGEEDYYIDKLVDEAEHRLLPESEASFNLSVFYGKDADWAAIINACRRYPMFAERQVVLLKEAQHMKDLDKLESYIENPLASTILIIAYKGKNYDKRTKFYKTISKHCELFQSAKLQEYEVSKWIQQYVTSAGYQISPSASDLLEEHLGNDLSRIVNEVDKLSLNLEGKKTIDEDAIEKYIGISKEFNVFALQAAIAQKDMARALMIIQYFESNPKASPIQATLPALYFFFSKLYVAVDMPDKSISSLRSVFFRNDATDNAKHALKHYNSEAVERILILLHHYNLRGIGVNDPSTGSATLLKEMVGKIIFSK